MNSFTLYFDRSKKTLHLDKWHKVVVNRDGRDGRMHINSHPPIIGKYPVRTGRQLLVLALSNFKP